MELAAQADLGGFVERVAGDGERDLVVRLELVVVPQVAGHEEVHDRPEVGHAVLHGGAGEDEAGAALEQLDGRGVLRGAVLDVLRLVEDDRREGQVAVELDVAAQQRVGGDDEVELGELLEVLVALRAAHREDLDAGREVLGLVRPVVDEAGRADDDGGLAGVLGVDARQREPGERLERLAEAHFVREDAAEAVGLEEAQP